LALLPIRHVPEPVLRRKTQQVKEITSAIHKLVEDMIDTMHGAWGVGLAANQVGVPLRLAVIQLPEDEQATVLINPKVVRREGEREVEEGCLSIPGYRGLVKRSVKVRIKALGLDGKPLRIKAEDNLLAQALEHETDHLDGVLYIDHLVSKDKLWKVEEDSNEEETEPATVKVASSS
jgi:peptide deformylase